MENKCFNNEREARIYRDSKRDGGKAASLFTYGKDRYKVEVIEPSGIDSDPKVNLQSTQSWLSRKAYDTSRDIEDLTKVKELIADPDFGCEIEDTVFVAKKLDKERWFTSPTSVIDFFDYPADSLDKIKEMVDIALKEYDDEWNEYLNPEEANS